MLQYIYKANTIGISNWPPGELRLAGIEVTDDPNSASVYVCPGNIRIFETTPGSGVLDHDKLYRLPYLRGNESRHAFFDVSDNFKTPINLPILFIRCDVRDWMLPHDPNTIQIAWGVEDFGDCIELPEGGFQFDVSFQGWLSHPTRTISTQSCLSNTELICDIRTYPDFFGYLPEDSPEFTRRRTEYRRSMKASRLALCPESISGVFPYRFFEAMSAGRVPLLVGSDFVFPFSEEIPYSQFCVIVSREDAARTDIAAREFLNLTSDDELIEMGRMARRYWAKYLDGRLWPYIHTYAVIKKLKELGVTDAEPVLSDSGEGVSIRSYHYQA